jgi:hypothetical protein
MPPICIQWLTYEEAGECDNDYLTEGLFGGPDSNLQTLPWLHPPALSPCWSVGQQGKMKNERCASDNGNDSMVNQRACPTRGIF